MPPERKYALQPFLVAIGFFIYFLPLLAQNTKYLSFEYLPLGEGQDINLVYHITQDDDGFMWFGTGDGLVRYDGTHCIHYPPDPKDSTMLGGSRVDFIKEDQFGNLWVLTWKKLQALNANREQFTTFSQPGSDSLFLYPYGKFAPLVVEDDQHMLWMRSRFGLVRIEPAPDPAQARIRFYQHHPDSLNSLSQGSIQSLLFDSHQRLWVGTKNGLDLYDPKQDHFVHCLPGLTKPVISLCELPDGRVLVGTDSSGLYLYNHADRSSKHFDPLTSGLAAAIVHQLARDGQGNIWLFAGSTQNGPYTLQRFDPHSGQFYTPFGPWQSGAVLNRKPYQLFVDNSGYLWTVMHSGIKFYDPYRDVFSDIKETEPVFGNWGMIYSLYTDRDNIVWMGSLSEGTIRISASRQKFEVVIPTQEDFNNRSSFFLSPTFMDRKGFLWKATPSGTDQFIFDSNDHLQLKDHFSLRAISFLETKDGQFLVNTLSGIQRYDYELGTFYTPTDWPEFDKTTVLSLEDNEGSFWLKVRGNGIVRYNPQTDSLTSFKHDQDNPNSISSNYSTGIIFKDKRGDIWIGAENGLNKFHTDGTFSHYLEGIPIVDIFEDHKGRFWITTPGDGLYQFDPNTGESRQYSKKEGFPTIRPSFIEEDDRGALWISSDVGLIRFVPEEDSIYVFDKSDGLPTSTFAYGSFKRDNGELFFPLWGGGFIRFHPDSLQYDQFKPRSTIVDFKLFNESVIVGQENAILTKPIWQTDQVFLKYDQNIFSLDFTSLHFAAPEFTQIIYQMEGVDKDWVWASEHRSVNYAGLRPGNYTFKVKSINHDDVEGEETRLAIKIYPPWWQTWWANCLYLVVAFSLIYLAYQYQKRRWQLQAQLEMEHRESERQKELNAVKARLYTNITHEFRTPLTIIQGMADQILKHPENWFREGIDMIKRNSSDLLQLVNQMLDLSKLESGTMSVDYIQGDIVLYLKYLLESFHSLAESKDLQLHFQSDVEAFMMDYDPDKIQTVVSNLLFNAIKFTPEGGEVHFLVRGEKVKGEEPPPSLFTLHSSLTLQIKDTGPGIPKEQLPYIFDRFYQADDSITRSGTGTGIGLALVKELVVLMNGEIEVQSTVGKGSTFIVSLPVTRKAPQQTLSREQSFDGFAHQSSLSRETPEVANNGNQEQPIILIVEDNADVTIFLESLLAVEYQIVTAENGQKGLEKALEIIPDLIISDVMMPELDGFIFCNTLKQDERTSHIPVILLTAKADITSKIEGLQHGADAYLSKPFNKEELLVRIEKMIELREKLQARYVGFMPLSSSNDKNIQIEDAFIKKLQRVVEKNIKNENFGILQLCEVMRISRPQLHRKLKALTGQSTSQYIRSLRLHKARDLLQNSNLNVSEVAYEVGFKSLSYFSTCFKKEFQVNPNELRN